jgi:peptidoglycan hydrolase CwlO-like protein|tara:strand:- start:347 stop:535 length:189 start_codon:yes stop_codon:yes gene_type:complete
MEDKIDKLIQGQVEIQTKLNTMDEKTKDQEKRIRSLEQKFWAALGTFFVGIATFIEGLFLGK